MNIPTSRDLLHPILQVARENPRLVESELHRFLAFQFDAYDGGPAISKPSDLRRFACRVRVARRALLRHGMLASGAGDMLMITPQGEAYLTTGWLRTTEGVEPADPARITVAPSPPDQAANQPRPPEEAEEPLVDLKSLLDQAQLESFDLGSGWFSVLFEAELRCWCIKIHVSHGWLFLGTQMMRLPKEPSVRAVTLDLMARLNFKAPAAKFSATPSDEVLLELEYRIEHVDAAVLGNLIRMLLQIAETEYARLARVVVGHPALQGLDAAFKRSA